MAFQVYKPRKTRRGGRQAESNINIDSLFETALIVLQAEKDRQDDMVRKIKKLEEENTRLKNEYRKLQKSFQEILNVVSRAGFVNDAA